MFCITVYQGNNAYSWNTTERSHPGSLIASPPTFNSPRVGASNPASRLSNVVLPHPLGPTIEKNSFFTTWKFTSSSASNGSPFMEQCTLLTCATSTWITLLLPSLRESLLSDVPGHREACGLAHEIVERETENSDQHHAEQDVVAAEQRSSVVDHVAETDADPVKICGNAAGSTTVRNSVHRRAPRLNPARNRYVSTSRAPASEFSTTGKNAARKMMY